MQRFKNKVVLVTGAGGGIGRASALRIAQEVRDAVIVTIVCDRGDRYLSTGVFPA